MIQPSESQGAASKRKSKAASSKSKSTKLGKNKIYINENEGSPTDEQYNEEEDVRMSQNAESDNTDENISDQNDSDIEIEGDRTNKHSKKSRRTQESHGTRRKKSRNKNLNSLQKGISAPLGVLADSQENQTAIKQQKQRQTVAYQHATNALTKMISGVAGEKSSISQNHSSVQQYFSGQQTTFLHQNNTPVQDPSQPMHWNERHKVYEINLKQREEARWVQVLVLMAKGDYSSAGYNAERMLELRKHAIEESKRRDYSNNQNWALKDIYGVVTESLLLAKCKLIKSNVHRVEEILIQCEENLKQMKIQVSELKKEMTEVKKEKAESKSVTNDDKSSAITRSRQAAMRNRPGFSSTPTFVDFKWMLSALATIAAFYNATGNNVKCESVYVRYVTWIEQFYGAQSLEASNCYFLVGLYYFEQGSLQKSLACFIKALYIRSKEFGTENHPACADCLLNMGILYKRLGVANRAIDSLQKALDIKREQIGHQSLPVAKVLEELGKFYLERADYAKSYQLFQECYEIRKRILKKADHEDVERISCLLIYLHKNIERELKAREEQEAKQKSAGARLVSLSDKMKGGMMKTLMKDGIFDDDGDDDHDAKLEKDLTKGNTLASKVMEDLYKRQKAAQNDAEMRRKKEQEELDKQRQQHQEAEYEKAIQNYVKTAVKMPVSESNNKAQQALKPSPFTAVLSQGLKQAVLKKAKDSSDDEDDIEKLVHKGFSNFLSVVQKSLFDRCCPHILSFLLSLTPQQQSFLQRCQLSKLPTAPLYFPQEFKHLLQPHQLIIYGRSQIWKIPRGKYLSYPLDVSPPSLIQPEQDNHRAMLIKDQRFLRLIQEVPEFLNTLNEVQKRILTTAVRHEVLLRYFFAAVSTEQMRQFESYVMQTRIGDAEQEAMLDELQVQMPFALKGSRLMEDASLIKVMDYKGEMCQMIDNIGDVEVFRCIDVDMPDNYIANLQVTQIQRLMKLKTELQGAIPDVREIQLTLKRFIIDLDVKEAYEFSILNPFLINEEELNTLVQDLAVNQHKDGDYDTVEKQQLELHHQPDDSEDSEEHDSGRKPTADGKHFNFNRAITASRAAVNHSNARKSLMNMDLDRLANEAQSRGEQHFSFTNATETAKNNKKGGDQQLKMIQERRDSSNEDSFKSDSDEYKTGQSNGYTPGKVSNFNNFFNR